LQPDKKLRFVSRRLHYAYLAAHLGFILSVGIGLHNRQKSLSSIHSMFNGLRLPG
jgi:hypothetical protein